MIQIKELKKNYGSGKNVTEVLKGITMDIEDGVFCAVMGPSGCGKSTLLHILCGIETADEGSCMVNGTELRSLKEKQLARYRNQEIGVVFQGFYLDESRSLRDNVAMVLGYAGVGCRERSRRADELLARVGLKGKEKKRPSQVSGGEQQRAAIARAIANQPKILLADEPTGNLDEANTRNILVLFEELHRDGMTILMVTHDPEVAAHAEVRIEMRDGRIISTFHKEIPTL